MDKWIYYQKNDNLYIAKVFYNKKEYYIGGFKKKEDAIKARDIAIDEIINKGNTTKYRSRGNSKPRKKNIDFDFHQTQLDEPEFRLRYAILMSALNDMCESPNSQNYIQSRKWILGKVKSPKTFSFDEICDLFHLDSAAVREKVININEKIKERLRTELQ